MINRQVRIKIFCWLVPAVVLKIWVLEVQFPEFLEMPTLAPLGILHWTVHSLRVHCRQECGAGQLHLGPCVWTLVSGCCQKSHIAPGGSRRLSCCWNHLNSAGHKCVCLYSRQSEWICLDMGDISAFSKILPGNSNKKPRLKKSNRTLKMILIPLMYSFCYKFVNQTSDQRHKALSR